MNGNSKFRYYNKMRALMKRQEIFIFSGKEIVQGHTATPLPLYAHFMESL